MFSFANARHALSRYRRRQDVARQVRRELGYMTDAELNDIGISRAAIAHLAREAAAQAT
ncbi:MAG: DUF1127 domain-containing protein [Dinoroseobacter sp.]|nr:DUF1127 domain-containing protein [Dinoroseobacter sp.]MDJ0994352.1 DUF1127 domain-containing protein [Dinoroseobacter sp.]